MKQTTKARFGTLEKDVLPQKIADSLLTMIKEKQLRPGDRLPPERELAATMGVGRPSLREALRALALMNIIEIRQGSGAYISSLEPSRLVEHLDFIFALDDSTFLQLFDARKILEVGIIALAAERITDEEIDAMEACIATSIQTSGDPEAFLQADVELHTMIIAAARNPILARFMESLNQLGLASRRRTAELPGVMAQSVEDHQALVAALKARDPEAARQAMLRHLDRVGKKLSQLSQLEAQNDEAT
jgi:GntR family transcriptional repressor for pyruvate dehydrogenase complex